MTQKFHKNLNCRTDLIQNQFSKYLTFSFHFFETRQNAIIKSLNQRKLNVYKSTENKEIDRYRNNFLNLEFLTKTK